jgi:hypothetical protein
MNAYVADRIAREHADRLMADGSAARRARLARQTRRATSGKNTRPDTDRAQAVTRPRPAAAAQFVARPFVAFHSWLLAGEL